MPYDPLESVGHMIDHGREALILAAGRSRSELDTDRTFAILLTHLMEIFGEASARIPEEFRESHPEFDWQEAVNFRNVLIHQFDRINYNLLWLAIQDELPMLIHQLEIILQRED